MLSPDAALPEVPRVVAAYLASLKRSGYQGEIGDGAVDRLINATDNSIYQVIPQAVLYPKTQDDLNIIVTAAQQPQFTAISFTARGGGTGTNGQSLNESIIVDTSRHLSKILDIDTQAKQVRVQPGVVLDQLNAALAPFGLFFPPEVSPGKSATLGGMVSTDGCGKGSCVYGKTSDYIVDLTCILPDGREIVASNYKDDVLRDILAQNYEVACLDAPVMPRGLSAYNIPGSYDSHSNHVNIIKLIAGSEGSLVFIKEIVLRVVEKPRFKAIITIGYTSFDTALRHVRDLVSYKPTAIETIDDHIVELARNDVVWYSMRDTLPFVQDRTDIKGLHFVEIESYTAEELSRRVKEIEESLNTHTAYHAAYHITQDKDEVLAIAALRRKCVGLLGNMQGNRRPVPFIEDTAVPPECLADYIRDLTVFLEGHDLRSGMFGHSDAGCLHVRPVLDLRQGEDVQFIRILTDGVVGILKKYHGVLWGEHGKGMRGEYTSVLAGSAYYSLMQEIKLHFDPYNRFNPGKIVASDENMLHKIDAVPLRGDFDRQIQAEYLAGYDKSVQCNGNGMCFSVMADDTMCPSYRVTRDRKHSPKGRAILLREWLRQKSLNSGHIDSRANDVFDSLSGCLSCKACTSTCPVHVNIPHMKSLFLEEYHRLKLRAPRDYILAHIEKLLPFQRWLPKNLVSLIGLVDLPEQPLHSLRTYMRREGFEFYKPGMKIPEASVFIVQDAFTSMYEPDLVLSVLQLLRKLGYEPLVLPFMESGKALYNQGFLRQFRRCAAKNVALIEKLACMGKPLIGIDPSMTLLHRDEYSWAVNRKLSYSLLTLQEWLDKVDLPQAKRKCEPVLFQHCTEKTMVPDGGRTWQRIFAKCGIVLKLENTGCCGMAGSYGHEKEHADNSRKLYEISWREKINNNSIVTGFSCRSQIKRMEGHRALHPAEILNDLF